MSWLSDTSRWTKRLSIFKLVKARPAGSAMGMTLTLPPRCSNSLSGHSWSSKWIFLFAALMAPEYAYPDPPDFTTDNLIGSTIFAQSETRTGSLRGWHERGGTSLGYSELGLGLSEYYRDGQVIFIITKTDSKLNQTIQDVRKLPMNIMDHKIVGNKLVFLKNAGNRYSLQPYCRSKKEPEAIVIGLAKPEKRFKDCSHRTRQIHAAWVVDATTGKLKTINPKGVTCLLNDFEYSCEHQQSGKE